MIDQEEKIISQIKQQIVRSNQTIERHISNLSFLERGIVSQDIIQNLRTFVEHISCFIYISETKKMEKYSLDNHYKEISKSLGYLNDHYQFIYKFHNYLQIVVSHYTVEPEQAERVMLKYYEFLIKIKQLLKARYNLEVLSNLKDFPLNIDKNLEEYYEKISKRLEDSSINLGGEIRSERYYIHKIKPFFVNQKIYYEVTFMPTNGNRNKNDRIIGFTKLELSSYYAVKLKTLSDNINVVGKTMPLLIITGWEVAIRPIEIERFSKIFGENIQQYASSSEGRGLMLYLQQSGYNLVDLISSDEIYYKRVRSKVLEKYKAKTSRLFDLFNECRDIILNERAGSNILRYLLYHMNNDVLESQYGWAENKRLSNLHLAYGCIPFDEMPFNSSLKEHNPKMKDLFDCIGSEKRKHELLARFIKQNTEQAGILYTPKKELEQLGNIDELVDIYNSKLYSKHKAVRKISERNRHLYIAGDEIDTIKIIQKLIKLSDGGLKNYEEFVDNWLKHGDYIVDDEEKQKVLRYLFKKSKVAAIYGSAGTGKTTLINHISNLFKERSRLYLAQTNPAVDNMKRRMTAVKDNTDFMTVTKFIKNLQVKTDFDILIIDECSTVSNQDMSKILEKAKFELLILVGDTYQIESIRFGNWFNAIKELLVSTSTYELTTPYRSCNKDLQLFWDKVRKMEGDVLEIDARMQYSSTFDDTIFKKNSHDEIVLCLNYDGLYGINNINQLLQQNNPNKAIKWGLNTYKVGDPVLFKDIRRFRPVIYNNIKGWIRKIRSIENKVQFDIEIDKKLTELDVKDYDISLLDSTPSGNSVIRFLIDDYRQLNEEGEGPESAIIPFQLAYAISIHKSQGLEYDSVKIIIADEIEENITHSIFYTAITRAKNNLKIYWTPEVQKRILENIRPRGIEKDVMFLKQLLQKNKSEI